MFLKIDVRLQREIARLHLNSNFSNRKIAQIVLVSPNTVNKLRKRLAQLQIDGDVLSALDDDAFLNRLAIQNWHGRHIKPVPDWLWVYDELKQRDVTLALLWQEWRETAPDGIGYCQFTCEYRKWLKRQSLSMRISHRAGEKLFVDFCGRTVAIIDPRTGEARYAQVFAAVIGASSYTFATAVWTQSVSDWVHCHVLAFEFFGGAPEIVVPDNLKAAVVRITRDELTLNASYRDCVAHYGAIILPARVRKPRDKPKAEVGVQIIQRWILAALRKRRFFSLDELNAEIQQRLALLNDRPFKKIPGSRRSRFDEIDKPALKPLPEIAYEYAEFRFRVRVGKEYHVEHEGHYYSLPSQYAHSVVDVRTTANTVEVLHQGKRIASHPRSNKVGDKTTNREHLPPHHRFFAEGECHLLASWAEGVGPSAVRILHYHLQERRDPTNGIRAVQRLQKEARIYGIKRFEEACEYAIRINSFSLASIRSVLRTQPDKRATDPAAPPSATIHENVRGADYFSDEGV
jgi:transposase